MTASGKPSEQATTGGPVSSRARIMLVAGMVGLVVILVFILQNLQDVKVSFFAVHWRAPLAVSLLLAAVLGGLIVFGAESVRLMQARKVAKLQGKQAQQISSPPTLES